MEKNSCPPAENYKMLPESLSEKMHKTIYPSNKTELLSVSLLKYFEQ
jgi:hypothetical protein